MKGTLDIKAVKEKIKLWFAENKKVKIIMIIGIIGMLLILASEFLPKRDNSDRPGQGASAGGAGEFDVKEYTKELEERLGELICSIDGVGETKVVIFMEQGAEMVYAKEGKESADSVQNSGQSQEKFASDYKYSYMEPKGGGKEPIVEKEIQPKVRGAVVICEGGGSVIIKEKVTRTVCAALDISSARVYVDKMTSD